MARPEWMRYAYHIGGCASIADRQPWNLSNLPAWPSHEAYVMDKRCSCGLRALVEDQTTNTTWVDYSFGFANED